MSKMPPKRRKPLVNPVVGTVSTRSTRRQSFVNIEIPKSNRSNKSTTKSKKITRSVKANEIQEFAENIKNSSKVILTRKEKSPTVESSQDAIDKDNRALLQILQDWDDDDEEHEIKTPTSTLPNYCDLNENSNISRYSDNKEMELMLSEGLENIQFEQSKDISKPIEDVNSSEDSSSMKDDLRPTEDVESSEDSSTMKDDYKMSELNFEATKDESSLSIGDSVRTEREEVIIEENASIPYADDMVVEELQNKEMSEEIMTDYEQTISDRNVADEEMIVENSEFSVSEQIEENASENSQSNFTADETVTDKNELDENVINIDEQNANLETMSNAEGPVVENQDEVQNEINSNLDQLNSTDTYEINDESSMYNLENTVVTEEGDELENMECTIEPSGDSNDKQTEDIYKSLETKVCELNLTDESQWDSFTGETNEDTLDQSLKTSSTNLETQEKIKTTSKNKKATKSAPYSKEISKSSKVNKTKVPALKAQNTETGKPIPPSKSKINKPPTFKIKLKDKKGKEPKSKKKPSEKPPKKTKEKPVSKEPDKLERQETLPDRPDKKEKKLGKFEEALCALNDTDGDEIRRSSRIKSISVLNKKTSGWGLVKSKSESSLFESDISDSNSLQAESDKSTPTASPQVNSKDRKSKSGLNSNSESPVQTPVKAENQLIVPFKNNLETRTRGKDPIVELRLKQFVHLKENMYKTDRMVCKEAKKMVCDCFMTQEEIEANEYGCGEDCLNRLLLIECGNLCAVGPRCTNKRFQKSLFAPVEVFNTEKKGLGLRAAANIPFGEFILEYVGEVLDTSEFDKRAEVYSQVKNIHYYFMALRADAVIDATMKGNISRFINHSCDPNAETQKWTVNGEIRIGFFSTRTILAGEEVTFDYRFQRYGKEAQKCFCGASICRGWLGEQPDSDEDDEEEEVEDEGEDIKPSTPLPIITDEIVSELDAELKDELKMELKQEIQDVSLEPSKDSDLPTPTKTTAVKKRVQKKKPRFEMFEEVDQLNEEIEMLITTGLKNQAHTLKLSRLMVRAKEPQQRAKLLRVLRRGELPCRRLFLDYHGLRLMHGYMIDAQQLVMANKKFESLRLEMLQTLAVLPIPNKSMLQDSKVLSTVEKWSTSKDLTSPPDSESNSPKDAEITSKPMIVKDPVKDESIPERSIEDQEEEIRFLATKLLEEWKNLKEVFRIPKKERIEQMKEHEREANKKFMQTSHSTYGTDDDKKMDRYRGSSKGKDFHRDRDFRDFRDFRDYNRRSSKYGDKPSAEFLRLTKNERRKLFALQHELREEERKLKQREMWREHEMNCMMIGVDPRFTAPFDPSRGYQYMWNQQMGQWQSCPTQNPSRLYPNQPPPHPHQPHHQLPHQPPHQLPHQPPHQLPLQPPHQLPHQPPHQLPHQLSHQPPHQIPHLNMPSHHHQKPPIPGYQFNPQINVQNNIGMVMNPPLPTIPPLPGQMSQHHHNQFHGQVPHNPIQGHIQPPLPHNQIQGQMQAPLPHHPGPGQMPPLPPNNPLPIPQNQCQMPPLHQNPNQVQLPPLPQNPNHGPMPPISRNPMSERLPPLPQDQQNVALIPLPETTLSEIFRSQSQVPKTTPPLPKMSPSEIEEDPSLVKFMGPIPPPVKLPPKWKCAKDKYGRPYYYHIHIRKSQWEPPPSPEPLAAEFSESESSTESSTVSSDSSSENSDSEEEVDDTKLLLEVRRQMDSLPKITDKATMEDDMTAISPTSEDKTLEPDISVDQLRQKNLSFDSEDQRPSIDMRLKQLDLLTEERPPRKKRRVGLCEEIIISPRTEEDKKQFKEDIKRYKANKEKLKRQREKIILQTKKQLKEIELKKAKERRAKTTVKVKLKEKPDFNSEAAKKIKETFRANMASTVVGSLNAYRRSDCTEGRITNTQDFKHLARKLTHFVMLKEMKHITKIEDLTCTDNVKVKAREFIRKYMSKFGEVYIKRSDSPDFKD